MNKIEEMKALVEKLNQYRDAYYNNAESIVTDHQYDDLCDQLEKMEKETGIILSNSPVHSVGYEVKSKLEKIEHSHLMMSLDKTKDVNMLRKFIGDKDSLLMCKMDGLTILLTYEDGELIQAETRGNGVTGEIITHNAKVFENIPMHINQKGHVEIEGEAIITYTDFEKINNLIKQIKPTILNSDNYEKLRDNNIISSRAGGGAPFLSTILKFFPSIDEAIEKAYNYNHTFKTWLKRKVVPYINKITTMTIGRVTN